MNRTKFKITIFALALVFVFSIAAFFAVNFTARADGQVPVSSNVFTSFGEANVIVDRQTVKGDDGTDKTVDYTMFTFGSDEDNVSYRRNLAYNCGRALPRK